MICGLPVGVNMLHMDLDLSDCGILSQRPRDFVYKGYTIEQFENPNQFKTSTELSTLSQIFTQDISINVNPFWGNEDEGQTIGITRQDFNIPFTFEPTCVFIGSVISDNSSNGISKKCVPSDNMGEMDELVTGEGTIEMIRKTPSNDVEEFQVKGTEVIDGNGVWCYQIPMNLDYVKHDEYGNIVPTNNPNQGIPTRARVRFRVSMNDFEENVDNFFRGKVLVPHNPQKPDELDYVFGTKTKEESYRDLFWNNVYTVKSYIPRFQRTVFLKGKRFTGIKHTNIYGQNNPMPYNNIRIRLPFMFTFLCAFIKTCIRIVNFVNWFIYRTAWIIGQISSESRAEEAIARLNYVLIADGLCPDLDGWYFAPGANTNKPYEGYGQKNGADIRIRGSENNVYLLKETYNRLANVNRYQSLMNIKTFEVECAELYEFLINSGFSPATIQTQLLMLISVFVVELNNLTKDNLKQLLNDTAVGRAVLSDEKYVNQFYSYMVGSGTGEVDSTSIDYSNKDDDADTICLTTNIDYLVSCIEMNLAQEYKVINFDFYNDWLNGTIYIPRWMRFVRGKNTFLFGAFKVKGAIKGCMSMDSDGLNPKGKGTGVKVKGFRRKRRYTQQCAIGYDVRDNDTPVISENMKRGCTNNVYKQKCHGVGGFKQLKIFGKDNGGIVHSHLNMKKQYVYYFKPCEWTADGKKVTLFANDLVLLGSLNDCSQQGIPQPFKYLTSTSYKMPTNLALTNMEDNAYLYGNGDDTICSGKHFLEETGVSVADNTLEGTIKHYRGTNEQIEDGDEDEFVALTEAAGIAWNYTGPDQGTPDFEKLYLPGGHFLGMSCVNSETNIKSCINLERVCEAGAGISQRHEIISRLENVGNEVVPRYKHLVPTGLISNDDIMGGDFRTMFATLNHNRLLSTSFDDTKGGTGYYKYDFSYMRTNGFNGVMQPYTPQDGEYNKHLVEGTDFVVERQYVNPEETTEQEIDDIVASSYTRTLENANRDYVMFRLGLDDLSRTNVLSKFVKSENGMWFMPQYENSFYFYFGLKSGATALDELNKQFFSNCSNNTDTDIE